MIQKPLSTRSKQQIVLQPTPFCNIDCRYCYLPNRSITSRMSFEVMERIFSEVLQGERFLDPINFVWHAGEPLTVPKDFYRQAFDLAIQINQKYQRRFFHSIQTNATLLTEEWADLFLEYKVKIGVSIDGPEFIHNKNRVTRSGEGTHDKVLRGIRILQEKGIQFTVIMVLTSFALDYPDEIFQFFINNGIKNVGFNIDELEGNHKSSSYQESGAIEKYKIFLKRFLQLTDESKGALIVREFIYFLPMILVQEETIGRPISSPNTPLELLTFDYQGNYSTFDPELAGTKSEKYHNFAMGNISTDPIAKIFENPVFQLVNQEIQRGVKKCEETCAYWSVCGGGLPSNKFFEHGRLDVTETIACRVYKQATTDVVLGYLENKLSPTS